MSAATLYTLFVPVFFALLLLEAWWLRRRGVANGYRARETWVSLGCAAGQLAIASVTAPLLATAYEMARERAGLFTTMNLSAAVRLTFFMSPLPLLGVPRDAFLAAVGVQLVWQTLMHTRLFERAGPLSRVLHVPATMHRIHHGRSRAEAARNLAPMLSVWDRLFGTFSSGPEPAAYGPSIGSPGGGILRTQWGAFAALWARARKAGPVALFSFDS